MECWNAVGMKGSSMKRNERRSEASPDKINWHRRVRIERGRTGQRGVGGGGELPLLGGVATFYQSCFFDVDARDLHLRDIIPAGGLKLRLSGHVPIDPACQAAPRNGVGAAYRGNGRVARGSLLDAS